MKKLLLIFIFSLFYFVGNSQQLFYQDVFYGGVTGGGFSSGVGNGASGQITVNIDPTSTIRKAYLLCNRYGNAQPVNVTLNSNVYNYNLSNQVGTNYFIPNTGTIDSCAIHAIDVTDDINPTQNIYNISYPNQFNTVISDKYGAFYLLILYENILFSKVGISLILNESDAEINTNYSITGLNNIDVNNPVGLALHSDIIWDTITDGSYINVNGNNIGLIGGSDAVNSIWTGGGVKGHFYYQNNNLFGLDDDTPDSLMAGTDGLANISFYTSINPNPLTINFQTSSLLTQYNIYLAFFLSYTTPCDTFTTTISPNDTICLGEPLQLNATGGVQYSWFSAFNGLNDTSIANPVATPTQTTTYVVTITNDSGCVKTEQVKIWVNPLPIPDTLIVTNNVCGDSVGSLTIGNIPNGTTPFNYQLTNLQTLITQNSSLTTFSNLGTGNYQLTITDSNGCQFTDTITITETNNVVANFTANPSSGVAPLSVDFNNSSQNANNYFWEITSLPFDSAQGALSQDSSLNTQYLFENSGNFQICLIAYNNIPICADTICKTIIVTNDTAITFIIPNVFTPNNDGNNDNFVIQVTGTSLIAALKVEVFNRWGQLLRSNEFSPFDSAQGANSQNTSPTTQYTIWDGRTTAGKLTPEGTYFYVISYTLKDDASATLSTRKGSITLLR